MIKALTLLLATSLLISTCSAATVNINIVAAVKCLLTSGGCVLDSSLITAGADSDVNIDVTSLLGAVKIYVNTTTYNSITFAGKAGSQLIVAAGNTLTVANTVAVAASTQLIVEGGVVTKGLITLADGTAASVSVITIQSGGSITTTGGIQVAGANTQLNIYGSLTINAASTLQGAINFANTSYVKISSGVTTVYGALVAAGDVTVSSSLAVMSSATSSAASTYTQTEGTLLLGDGASGQGTINATVNINNDAVLAGNGQINGDVYVNSQISIGNSPGSQVVNGNYAQGGTSTFNLDIASSSSYDRLFVTGNVKLDGSLKCINDNYNPSKSESYKFITASGTVSGSFKATIGNTVGNFYKYSSGHDDHSVTASYNNNAAMTAASVLVVAFACLVSFL